MAGWDVLNACVLNACHTPQHVTTTGHFKAFQASRSEKKERTKRAKRGSKRILVSYSLHLRKLTWNLKIHPRKGETSTNQGILGFMLGFGVVSFHLLFFILFIHGAFSLIFLFQACSHVRSLLRVRKGLCHGVMSKR